jgi:phage tail-like protein
MTAVSATTPGKSKPITGVSLFEVKIGTLEALGLFHQCSGLELEVEIFRYEEGGNNHFAHHLPGRVHYRNLVLSRGMTAEKALHDWFWKTREKADPKEITLTLLRHANERVRTWTFENAYPVRWTGPALDANGVAVAMETLEIAHSGMREAGG